jgi:hypothetical protein
MSFSSSVWKKENKKLKKIEQVPAQMRVGKNKLKIRSLNKFYGKKKFRRETVQT